LEKYKTKLKHIGIIALIIACPPLVFYPKFCKWTGIIEKCPYCENLKKHYHNIQYDKGALYEIM